MGTVGSSGGRDVECGSDCGGGEVGLEVVSGFRGGFMLRDSFDGMRDGRGRAEGRRLCFIYPRKA